MKTQIPQSPDMMTKKLELPDVLKRQGTSFDINERRLEISQDDIGDTPNNDDGQRLNSLGLYFEKFRLEFFVELNKLTKVGRSYPQIFDYDGIDLSAFDAYMQGVSREHAFFQYVGDMLVMIDNHSINGTWLNNVKVEPLQPYQVEPGDSINLGSLEFVITEL